MCEQGEPSSTDIGDWKGDDLNTLAEREYQLLRRCESLRHSSGKNVSLPVYRRYSPRLELGVYWLQASVDSVEVVNHIVSYFHYYEVLDSVGEAYQESGLSFTSLLQSPLQN